MTATSDIGPARPADPASVPVHPPVPDAEADADSADSDSDRGTGGADSDAADSGVRAFDPGLFRSVFRRHAAGVAVITATGPAGPAGFTATSLTSVAAEPPLLSFGISSGSSSWPAVTEAPFVGVHILGEHQEDLAARFARSGADRFGPATAWTPGPHGVPLLDGVSAWLIGRVVGQLPAGDHRIVVAQAVAGDPHGPGGPLLYHGGGFHRLSR